MKKIILFLLIFSLCIACNKNDEPTHEDWTKDDNIFRCKVNGLDWEPKGDNLGFSDDDLDIYYENFFLNSIQIRASRETDSENDFMSISFFVGNGVNGKHDILGNQMFTDFNCGNYYRDTIEQSIIDIESVDTENNIIEGTFYFTANEGSSSICTDDVIVVTEGYFKAKYRN